MQSYRVTIHRSDGEPAKLLHIEAESDGLALQEAGRHADQYDIPVKMVELEYD